MKKKYCSEIFIIGNQNTGKSSLMNKLLEKKISITSNKKNTTQRNILSVKKIKNYKFIYVDTPGFKKNTHKKNILKKINFKRKFDNEFKIVILVLDKNVLDENTKFILKYFQKKKIILLLVLNKIDKIKNKNIILPFIKIFSKISCIKEIIPLSSKTGENIEILKKILKKYIPENKKKFEKNEYKNFSFKFQIHEIIREKIMRYFGDELPYTINIKIHPIKKNKNGNMIINSDIFLKNSRQKKIFIGKKGNKIKLLSLTSRKDLEKFFNKKIHLYIWIKSEKK